MGRGGLVRLPVRYKLPEEALDQLRGILDGYDRMSASSGNSEGAAEARKLRDDLANRPQQLWWTDIAQAELCTLALLNEQELRARLGGWRRRLREVATDARYQEYLTTSCNATTATVEDLRADLSECIRAVYYFYGAYGLSAKGRTHVSKQLLGVSAGVILIQVALGFAFAFSGLSGAKNIATYALATSFFAVLGSIVSVQRRLQDPSVVADPYYQYIQTSADWFGIAVTSPVFAAIFGLIMYGLLESALISTKFVTFNGAIPTSVGDTAVLFVLGFVAGFAEQLVPDAISRIASRTLAGVTQATPAVKAVEVAPPGDGARTNVPGSPA